MLWPWFPLLLIDFAGLKWDTKATHPVTFWMLAVGEFLSGEFSSCKCPLETLFFWGVFFVALISGVTFYIGNSPGFLSSVPHGGTNSSSSLYSMSETHSYLPPLQWGNSFSFLGRQETHPHLPQLALGTSWETMKSSWARSEKLLPCSLIEPRGVNI